MELTVTQHKFMHMRKSSRNFKLNSSHFITANQKQKTKKVPDHEDFPITKLMRSNIRMKPTDEKWQQSSMPEVPHVGEEKRNAILITAVYGIPVSDAATRLCNNTNPALTCFFHRIIPGCLQNKQYQH